MADGRWCTRRAAVGREAGQYVLGGTITPFLLSTQYFAFCSTCAVVLDLACSVALSDQIQGPRGIQVPIAYGSWPLVLATVAVVIAVAAATVPIAAHPEEPAEGKSGGPRAVIGQCRETIRAETGTTCATRHCKLTSSTGDVLKVAK